MLRRENGPNVPKNGSLGLEYSFFHFHDGATRKKAYKSGRSEVGPWLQKNGSASVSLSTTTCTFRIRKCCWHVWQRADRHPRRSTESWELAFLMWLEPTSEDITASSGSKSNPADDPTRSQPIRRPKRDPPDRWRKAGAGDYEEFDKFLKEFVPEEESILD